MITRRLLSRAQHCLLLLRHLLRPHRLLRLNKHRHLPNLLQHLRENTRLRISFSRDSVTLGHPGLFDYSALFMTGHAGFTWTREGLAMVLTLPTSVPALPVVYVLGAAIWNTTNADACGPMWPVTLVYTVMFAGMAMSICAGGGACFRSPSRSR